MFTGPSRGARLLAGRYRLVSVVGRGGMGTVWRARDEVLDRDVAVKEVLVPPGLDDADRAVLNQRTLREARATARLNHPAIVTVHDVVDEDDRPWIVMEFLPARSLQQIIDEDGPQPPRRVAEIGRETLGALQAAHAVGVLHRDVKPGNVLITEGGHAVLTDFGIAHLAGDPTLTQSGLVMGSPAYIAPERAQGLQSGPAADLWALGATLYAACEGRPPHDRADALAVLTAIMTENPPPARSAGALQPILWGLLDRDPVRRMDAAVAGDLLAQVASGAGPTAVLGAPTPYDAASASHTPEPPPPHGSARPRRAIAFPVLGALAVLLVTAAAFLLPRQGREAPPPVTRTSASPTASGPAKLPGGWRRVDGPGYTIGVPAGWTSRTAGRSVFWDDPASAAYLQVDRTDWQGEPYPAWKQWEREVQVKQSLRDYHRVSLRQATGTPYDAADIEFTWTGGGGVRMHGVDRRIVAAGQRYTVFVAIPDAQWGGGEELTTGFLSTFAPAP